MRRREFLRYSAASVTAVGAAPLLSGCSRAVDRASFPAAESIASLGDRLDPVSCQMLYHASLAPSGHNAQPWRVRVRTPDRWQLGVDPARRLTAVDPHDREAMLSLGAFLENLTQAGQHLGRPVELAGTVDNEEDPAEAVLFVGSSDARAVNLAALSERRTLHGPLAPRRLRRAHVRELLLGIPDGLYVPPGSQQADWLNEAAVEAVRAQIHRAPVMEELSKWIQWDNAGARARRAGLTPAALGIDGFAGWWTRTFYEPEDVLAKRFGDAAVRRAANEVGSCGGWLIVTSPDDRNESLLRAGRHCERLWLRARSMDVGIHPMSQALEESPGREQIANLLGTEGPVQFLLRVGYAADYPAPVSLRLPLNAFVTVNRGSDVVS